MTAVYARQSVDKKDSISIETQIELCTREIPAGEEYRVYADRGFSGSNINRPAFQQLLEAVRRGEIRRIVTYRLDRISRSVLDFAGLVDFFGRYQVSFNSTQEKFDTGTPIGRAMLNIVMTFAQLERETIQQRIRDNYYARGEKGMYLGGPAPYGFVRRALEEDGGKRVFLAPGAAAETLIRLYRLYDGGQTLGEIARLLNSQGTPSPGGVRWDSAKVSRVLRNPAAVQSSPEIFRYYRGRGCRISDPPEAFTQGRGCYLYGKDAGGTLTLAPHPGLVPAELFLRCQRRLDGNVQIANRRPSRLTWLAGLLVCADCGHSVVPKDSGGGRYRYLCCTGRLNLGCCRAGSLGRPEEVEAAVERRIFAWAQRHADAAAPPELGRGDALRQAQMLETEEKIRRLVDLAAESSEVTVSYLNEKLTQLEAERRALAQPSPGVAAGWSVGDLPRLWPSLSPARKRQAAGLLVKQVRLSPAAIELVWRCGK